MRATSLAACGATLACPTLAFAEDRPTEGGLWSFDVTDQVESWEEPTQTVRVHYSIGGPNVTRLEDLDEDGVPDFAQDVAERTAESVALFVSLGFRPPVPESAIETELGGSPALDVYLVDFGGAADGRFGVDGCGNEGCAGFYVIENDFAGYGYATVEEGITTVTSHEIFHGVQAAYNFVPTWLSEGTAVWAERQFDPDSADFIHQCGGLLADPGRPIYQPPGGPVAAFAYGTGLWFDFLSERHDASIVVELLEALVDDSAAEAPELVFEGLLAAHDDDLETAWASFARYNLAAGFRSGVATSHPYAGRLDAIKADAEGEVIALDARFFPLAANYYNLQHPGGDAWFVADAALEDVAFSLHPVGDFAADGAVGDPIATWSVDAPSAQMIYEDLPAGGYWIVGARTAVAEGSARANVCASADPADPRCPQLDSDSTSSSGGGSSSDSSGGEPDDEGSTSGTTGIISSGDTQEPTASGAPQGCGCRSTTPAPPLFLLVFLSLLRRRP